MTALSADRKTDKLGAEDLVYPGLLKYPVEASTSIYGGALVAINAAGNAVPASAIGALKCVGRCERQCLNLATGGTISPDGMATGTAGSISVLVRQGLFYFNINTDSTITKASFGVNVYASDDNTVSTSDAGGTRPYAGFIVDPQQSASLGNMNTSTTQVGVMVGVANPYALNPELQQSPAQFKARAVVTTLQANTGSGTNVLTETANGAISAADGVTLAVGDVVFIQEGTTNLAAAKDAGPWTVTALGGAGSKWTLTRPDWWTTGATMPLGAVIDLGGEGTLWQGSQWKSFAASGKIVGTDAPVFWVGRITQSLVLVAGTVTVTNVGIRSATTTGISIVRTTANTSTATTGGYHPVGAITPGVIGTASAVIDATVAAGTINNADVSTLAVTFINW